MSRRGKVSGWVLTVVVVLVLGAVLIALLLPAVQSAREASRIYSPFNSLASLPGQGQGPGLGGDKFDHLEENDFIAVADKPLSTLSIDVDTASYSKVRSYLTDHGQLPPQDAVRIEELINYFDYQYPDPDEEHPFSVNVELASCPWNRQHRLARVGIKAKEMEREQRPPSNLVFLLDVSGSMNQANKLPLVTQGMKLLSRQLTAKDRVAIVVYASATGVVLDTVPGDRSKEIQNALAQLEAGGSTNGGAGIHRAYQLARDNLIEGGTNRVILCTDGDFNVGTTSTGELVRLAKANAKQGVYLSVLGFGIGNHNDAMLEEISNEANGNYAFIDNMTEAKKVLVEELSGTIHTVAKDVKIQVEFNPMLVAAYRLVGYENRLLADQDFNDDEKDAGEIGAGHTVTALYEVVPAGIDSPLANPGVSDLKYQSQRAATKAAEGGEVFTVKLRYKRPESNESELLAYGATDNGVRFDDASGDFKFAASVAMFGMILRDSKHAGTTTLESVLHIAEDNQPPATDPYRSEFIQLVSLAKSLK